MHGVVVRGRVRHEVTVSSVCVCVCVVFCELSISCMAVTSWDGKPPMVYASIPEVGRWNGGGLFLAATKRRAPSPVSRSMAVLFFVFGNPIVLHGVGCRYCFAWYFWRDENLPRLPRDVAGSFCLASARERTVLTNFHCDLTHRARCKESAYRRLTNHKQQQTFVHNFFFPPALC